MEDDMRRINILFRLTYPIIFHSLLLSAHSLWSQNDIIPFSSDHWNFFNGEVVEHLGRQSLSGSAMLKNVEFENGVIEFEIAVNGERSYPGIFFRVQSRATYEHFYIRPHRSPYYTDALQYAPAFNNVSCWQLYNGNGFTAGAEIPRDEWIHVKMEIKGRQARVFINKSEAPSLVIRHLKHGYSKGGLTLNSPRDGSAYFSNFTYRIDNDLPFESEVEENTPIGMMMDWEISKSFRLGQLDLEKTPAQQNLTDLKWQRVTCEPSGLVNLSRYLARTGREPDCVFTRTMIPSDGNEEKELKFGYSDAIIIFLNGRLIFSGSSFYQQRDPSFLGIIGLYDSVMLPLQKGENELLFIVAESFGGWGFMCQDGKAVFQDKNITRLWESEKRFETSESVLYDPKREVLYVSSFDQYNVGNPRVKQFISKVSLDGEILNLKWIDGLSNPLGMTIHNDRLFVAERKNVAEINLDEGKVIKNYPVDASLFLNDIAIDEKGHIYITDSRKDCIWKYSDGQFDIWLSGSDISDPNVIYYYDNTLFVGNSGDRSLKSIDPASKEVTVVATFEPGFIDGFRVANNGDYLVSLWRGLLFRVTPSGKVKKILDTSTPGMFSADFEYIKEKHLLVIPTFYGNRIVGYSLK